MQCTDNCSYIQAREDIAPEFQRLLYCGKELDDRQTVGFYETEKDHVYHLVVGRLLCASELNLIHLPSFEHNLLEYPQPFCKIKASIPCKPRRTRISRNHMLSTMMHAKPKKFLKVEFDLLYFYRGG